MCRDVSAGRKVSWLIDSKLGGNAKEKQVDEEELGADGTGTVDSN